MKVFNYHPATGEFLCEEAAHPNPLEPGNWLIPAFATTIAPPTPAAGRVCVFNSDDWTQEQDHRGEFFWFGRQRVVMNAIGPVPVFLLPRPRFVDRLRMKAAGIALAIHFALASAAPA
jgi:hypothetical protein